MVRAGAIARALVALALRGAADDVLVDYEDAELRRFTCQGYHIASPPFPMRTVSSLASPRTSW